MQTDLFIAFVSGICAIIGMLLTYVMNGISNSLKELNINVASLNIRMGVTVEKVDNHEKRLSSLEKQF